MVRTTPNTGAAMTPTTALIEPPTETVPTVEEEIVSTDEPTGQVRPHPAEWYDTPEFRRQLMEHFTKATRIAIASGPPDMPR